MRIPFLLATVFGLASPASTDAPYLSLTRQFATFAEATAALPDDVRLARFDAEIAPLFPGFYAPHEGETAERHRARVLGALQGFPALKARYEAVERSFPAAYAAGLAHYRAAFPGFRDPAGAVFLHSLGELDGGTRTLRGRSYLMFGADGIARYHAPDSLQAFLDHELFHVEHARHFADCDPIWCGLWQEGLATYAAATMNPGASDRLLMLDAPRPIRAATDAQWRAALCLLDAKRSSTAKADYELFFFGNANGTSLPPRFGYYLGYRLAERAGRNTGLRDLAALDHAAAQALVERTLASMVADAGGCAHPAPGVATPG